MKRESLYRSNAVLAALLVALYLAWWWFAGAPDAALPLTALVVACGSLLLLLPFLWTGSRFATSLAGFIVPFHFAFAVMELVANPSVRGWVAAQAFLALLMFVLVMASLRQIRPQDARRPAA